MKKRFLLLALLIFFIIPHAQTNAVVNEKKENTYFTSKPVLNSYANDIASYIQNCQETERTIEIMDSAYYTGKIIENIWNLQPDLVDLSNNPTIDNIFTFVSEARNPDGGYGNWKNGKSSMESTFQALDLYLSLGKIDMLSSKQINDTLGYILSLQVIGNSSIGFFPISNWDAPDLTSTYRATSILNRIGQQYMGNQLVQKIIAYVKSSYSEPFFLGDPSGFAEIRNGTADLLATNYAITTLNLLNSSDIHGKEVAGYVNLLHNANGGIAGKIGGNPTTGYTRSGVEVYLILSSNSYNLSSSFDPAFLQNAINFVKSNKLAGTGFTTSARDSTPQISSTYFAMEFFSMLFKKGIIKNDLINLQDILNFIQFGNQATFGYGNYPGDTPDLSFGTRAILSLKVLNKTDYINLNFKNFLDSTYSSSLNAYGFREGSEPTLKYTYYGIRAARALNSSLPDADLIKNYILSTQNPDGFFGKKPSFQLSYISYTYWALASLKLLNLLNENTIDYSKILSQLRYYQNIDYGYTNFPGGETSIISTYRALKIQEMLGQNISNHLFMHKLKDYHLSNGGFIDRVNRTIPTMEATYYGFQIEKMLNIPYNVSLYSKFIESLHNNDGGFTIRPGFSSRISSTYWAISLLYQLENQNVQNFEEDVGDYLSPIIFPSFNPGLDTNKSISGTFLTYASISDPETGVQKSWVEINFHDGNTIVNSIQMGVKIDISTWSFVIGPFTQGEIDFRIVAIDLKNNYAYTDWFTVFSEKEDTTTIIDKTNLTELFIQAILPVSIVIAIIDAIKTFQKGKRSEIKMKIENETQTEIQSMNFLYIILVIGTISSLSRILIGDALLVLQSSLYLFQFLFAVLTILFLRYVVGMKSYGYFGPSVIALSWLRIGFFWGFFIFLNLFIIGLIVSNFLYPYGLPVGFRIGTGMIVLVSSLALFEMIGEVYMIPFLAGSILIPVIITPWMSDRFVMESKETNPLDASLKFGSTMIITSTAFLVMSMNVLVAFVATHPEIWVLLVVLTFYFGRTRLYTYFDARRFSRLIKNKNDPLTLISRNRDYIAQYNPSIVFPFINKFNMKELFDKWRVPTARLYAVIEGEEQIDKIMKRLQEEDIFKDGFVIKPSDSYGGKGIVVIKKRENSNFIIGDSTYHPEAIKSHIKSILQGEFLTSQTKSIGDIAIIEEKIVTHPEIANISTGLADIRVIVFRGIPIMCMTRLPTEQSEGKANLKQGAIGAAIDMGSGIITRAEFKQHDMSIHPDTKKLITGYQFDNWQEILAVACLAQKSTSLGYAGVDLVIDEQNRVLVLEINKRPGLEIQNINLDSLLKRIQFIEKNDMNAEELSPIRAAKIGIELGKTWEELL